MVVRCNGCGKPLALSLIHIQMCIRDSPRGVVVFDSQDYPEIDWGDSSAHELKLVGNKHGSYSNPIFRVDAFDEYPDQTKVAVTKDLAKLVAEYSVLEEAEYTAEPGLRLRIPLKKQKDS